MIFTKTNRNKIKCKVVKRFQFKMIIHKISSPKQKIYAKKFSKTSKIQLTKLTILLIPAFKKIVKMGFFHIFIIELFTLIHWWKFFPVRYSHLNHSGYLLEFLDLIFHIN